MRIIFPIFLSVLIVAAASAQVPQTGAGGASTASTYQGIVDVFPGPQGVAGCWSLRACSHSQLGGTTKSINLRRASDNATCDFDINISGDFGGSDSGCASGGGITPTAFATQDATATCTISTTTATCTGASSTPHQFSSITGAGLTQPCWAASVGTFTAGAGTVTLLGTGSSPCGTIGVGETLTFTYALFVANFYDQSANAFNVGQATAGSQPMFLPNCLNAFPCIGSNGALNQFLQTAYTLTTSTNTLISAVGMQRATHTGTPTYVLCSSGTNSTWVQAGTLNTVGMFQGSLKTFTAADNVWHVYEAEFNGAQTAMAVDATDTSPGSAGAQTLCESTAGSFKPTLISSMTGYMVEAAMWVNGTSNPTVRASICHNQFTYWGTPTSC